MMLRCVAVCTWACLVLGLLETATGQVAGPNEVRGRLQQYATVRLTADLSGLTARQQQMIPLLIEAAEQMDAVFWQQAYGDRDRLLAQIDDESVRQFVRVNYGPWDRLNGNQPFVPSVGPKPAGANFYPHDLTKEQFTDYLTAHPDRAESLRSLYTMVRRNDDGEFRAIPYHQYFADRTEVAVAKLRAAAELADEPQLRRYLVARAEALATDDYQASDLAWLDMKNNTLDVVIGPIETYEDQLFGYKAAHEAYVLVKDKQWSQQLDKYAQLLPALQRRLPVPDAYKQEQPGSDSDLNAYDVIYYAGDCNAGAKTIAINLPNDEQVQLQKGTRRLQLKNAMRAKFDRILQPISEKVIDAGQREHVHFEAFFANTMFHEVTHGLGVKNTIDGKGTVRDNLKELSGALEECKADILGLFMIGELYDMEILSEGVVMDNYVTYMAGIFRSTRFGASSAHGRANMISFNYFAERGAFQRSNEGTYRVDRDKMGQAIADLSQELLTIQGDGDYSAAARLLDQYGQIGTGLQADLDRVNQAGIPVDIVFEQGLQVLGLEKQAK